MIEYGSNSEIGTNAYVSQRDTIPDIVSFRVDVPAWIDSLL